MASRSCTPRPATPIYGIPECAEEPSDASNLPVIRVSCDWYTDQSGGKLRGFDDNTTVYSLVCHTVVDGVEFKVEKRYSDFVKFKQLLIDEGSLFTSMPFPPHFPLRSLLGGLSDRAKDERARGLEVWLNSVIDSPFEGNLNTINDALAITKGRAALKDFLTPRALEEDAVESHGNLFSKVGLSFGSRAQETGEGSRVSDQGHGGIHRRRWSEPQPHWALLDALEAGCVDERQSI